MPSIASEAKLEAEYIVRRFTVKFVEQLRSVVNDTSNSMLSGLDELLRESGHEGVLGEDEDAKAAIPSGRAKSKRSSD